MNKSKIKSQYSFFFNSIFSFFTFTEPFLELLMGLFTAALATLLTLGLIGCGKGTGFDLSNSQNSLSAAGINGSSTANLSQVNSPPLNVYKAEALVWESATKPERIVWSNALFQIVQDYFSDLNLASDISTFCPAYQKISTNQKINAWANLFAATAYYESAWVPASKSVDVGTQSNVNTWSVGLLQMSVVDQQSYNLQFGFNFTDLQDAIKNLQLGVAVMAKQVKKKGTILIPVGGTGLYWATLHPGGRYDQTAGIAAMTKKLSFCK